MAWNIYFFDKNPGIVRKITLSVSGPNINLKNRFNLEILDNLDFHLSKIKYTIFNSEKNEENIFLHNCIEKYIYLNHVSIKKKIKIIKKFLEYSFDFLVKQEIVYFPDWKKEIKTFDKDLYPDCYEIIISKDNFSFKFLYNKKDQEIVTVLGVYEENDFMYSLIFLAETETSYYQNKSFESSKMSFHLDLERIPPSFRLKILI